LFFNPKCRVSPGKLIRVGGGPRLLGEFYAECLVDEQFLTLAPQIAGRNAGERRLSFVMGTTFAPRKALQDLDRPAARQHSFPNPDGLK
jgi:dihydrofolate reductase